jgi:Zn-dependent protease with chaperone function
MVKREPAADQHEYTPLQKQILAALREEIERPQTTTAYKLGMFAVAIANLMLPLLYFGLIFLVAHAIYWNARFNAPAPGRGPVGLIIYLGTFILGGVTLVFLIKPLFARDSKASEPLLLKRSSEPFLYEYVETICEALDAPVPDAIQLVCEPNASAGFAGGLMGLFTRRMRLTIGLPLIAGMSLRQVTGILAHEFGHFSQGTGMRMTFVVRTINYWLLKIVFLRDSLDEKLERFSNNSDWKWKPLVYSVRFCIWLSRQVLYGLLWLGNAISCFLMRQMEFDADRYEARMVGFRTFVSSCSRLSELSIAHQMSINDLQRFHTEGRLADDLPALTVFNVGHINPEFRKEYRKMQLAQKTGLFDTHPADRERIDNVRDEGPFGVFLLPGEQKDPPATVILDKLEKLSRKMTTDFYAGVLGKKFKQKLLHPVNKLIERRAAEIEAGKALDRYFQVHIPVDRPLPLYDDSATPPSNPREAAFALKEARDAMLRELPAYRDLPELYEHAENTLFTTAEALSVMDCGKWIRGKDFGLASGNRKGAEAKQKRAKNAVQFLAAKMLVFETAASERMSAALQLLQVPKVASVIADGQLLQTEMRDFITDARLVSGIIGGLPTLRILYRRTSVLFSRLGKRNNHELIASIIDQLTGIATRLSDIHEELRDKRYPFDHADATMTLQDFVIPYVPEPLDINGVMGATEMLFQRLYTIQVRLFAKMAQAAEKVETALGLPPLPEPETKSAAKSNQKKETRQDA